MKNILAMAALAMLAGCASPGPIYRGAPPIGMTDAEYRCKLAPSECWKLPDFDNMRDDGGDGARNATGGPAR